MLVEKAMGLRESLVAVALISLLRAFVKPRNLGLVTGEGGTIRFAPGLIRVPDVAFISWSRIPGGRVPKEPVPQLAPDLAIEVLSEGNTKAEMQRKRSEYFDAGVDVVWEVDPERRQKWRSTSEVRDKPVVYDQTQTIENVVRLSPDSGSCSPISSASWIRPLKRN